MFLKFYQGPRMKGMCGEKCSYSILLLLSVGALKNIHHYVKYISDTYPSPT